MGQQSAPHLRSELQTHFSAIGRANIERYRVMTNMLNRLFARIPWNTIALTLERFLWTAVYIGGLFPWQRSYNFVKPIFRFFGKGLRVLAWPLTSWVAMPIWGRVRPRLVRMGLVSSEPLFPWKQLFFVGKPFWVGNQARTAWWHLAGILTLMFGNIGMNYMLTRVPGWFNDAVLDGAKTHSMEGVMLALAWWVGVIIAAMPVGVFYGWLRTRLGIVWRLWLTSELLGLYLNHRAYMQLNGMPEIDNTDQRMTQDVDGYCNQVVNLFISLLDAFVTVATFASVLYFISGQLTLIVIGAAAFGSLAVFWIGRKLPSYSFRQSKSEADLRSVLQSARREAEALALYHGEEFATRQAMTGLNSVGEVLKDIMNTWRNISMFNTVYNQVVPLIPSLIVATLFVQGGVNDFGRIAAATGAFMAVYNGLTVFGQQFGTIASLKAVTGRLAVLKQALLDIGAQQPPPGDYITFEEGDQIAFKGVTVRTGYLDKRVSIENLTLDVTMNLAVLGPNGSGKGHFAKAIAGLWPFGTGTLTRPPSKDVLFLTAEPFLPTSTLRDVLTFAIEGGDKPSDDRLREVLNMVELRELEKTAGGFDAEQNWKAVLPLASQQRLSLARMVLVRPKYAVIHQATSALEDEIVQMLYTVLRTNGTRYITTATSIDVVKYHDAVLELDGSGAWKIFPADQYKKPGWKRFLGL